MKNILLVIVFFTLTYASIGSTAAPKLQIVHEAKQAKACADLERQSKFNDFLVKLEKEIALIEISSDQKKDALDEKIVAIVQLLQSFYDYFRKEKYNIWFALNWKKAVLRSLFSQALGWFESTYKKLR